MPPGADALPRLSQGSSRGNELQMIIVSLRPGLQVVADAEGSLLIRTPGRTMRPTCVDKTTHELLLRLADAPLTWDESMSYETTETTTPQAPSPLAQLAERRLVQLQCSAGSHQLMIAEPTGGPSSFAIEVPLQDTQLKLSRFAYIRSVSDELVIELPHRFLRVRKVAPEVLVLMSEIAGGASLSSLTLGPASIDSELMRQAIEFFHIVGIADRLPAQQPAADEFGDAIATREFHDVAFHAHSRTGLADGVVGSVFPFAGSISPTPAIKSPTSATRISLSVPSIADVTGRDKPLGTIMEERRSVRRYGRRAVTLDEISKFLYRVARVRRTTPADEKRACSYETTDRTYPSGGACYDLELYITFRLCSGIAPGVYHYDPLHHALSVVSDRISDVHAMIEHARVASGQSDEDRAPVLITLASRFSRLSWKYRAISYATTLKNVGVLYEAMYLVATAMGLAPCALGSGNSALFGRVTGLHPLVESSVGEFMLGSRSEDL
jgi:oxazoline/thiazoline dehydrogenase